MKPLIVEAMEARALLATVPAGSEFPVNTATGGDQFAPAVAMDRAGDFVVVWASAGQDGSGYGTYAQQFNAAGAAQGAEFQVNTYTTGHQTMPAVAMDESGDFTIAWMSTPADANVQPAQDGSGAGIFARRYNSAGAALDAAEFQVNTYTSGNQESPRIACDGNGNFVIAWDSSGQDGSAYGVYARRFTAAGTPIGGEFQVNTATVGTQQDPDVAMDRAGDFIIAFTGLDASSYGIYARRYNPAGTALDAAEFPVNTYTADFQDFPRVAMDTAGDFVVAWNSYGQDGSQYGVYARRYSASGAALDASEFRANTFTAGNQRAAAVGMDGRRDFSIVWTSDAQDGSGRGIYGQNYDYLGNAGGSEFKVNTTTAGDQMRPALEMDRNGDYAVAWQSAGHDGSGFGVFAQRYLAPDQVPPAVTAASFSYLTGQSLTFTFSENVGASLDASDILVQNLTTNTTVPATATSVSYNSTTNTATVAFPGFPGGILPDGNYRATLLSSGLTDSAGNALDGDGNGGPGGNYTLDFFVLAGDANHDGKVDVIDLGILATNWQQSPRDFSQGDFNYDGVVDVIDLGILATNWQKQLP